jgi:hypothetical protein
VCCVGEVGGEGAGEVPPAALLAFFFFFFSFSRSDSKKLTGSAVSCRMISRSISCCFLISSVSSSLLMSGVRVFCRTHKKMGECRTRREAVEAVMSVPPALSSWLCEARVWREKRHWRQQSWRRRRRQRQQPSDRWSRWWWWWLQRRPQRWRQSDCQHCRSGTCPAHHTNTTHTGVSTEGARTKSKK